MMNASLSVKESFEVMKMKKVKFGGTLMEIKTFVNMIMRSTEKSNSDHNEEKMIEKIEQGEREREWRR